MPKDIKTKSSKDAEVKEVTKEVKEAKEPKERAKHNAATEKAGLSFNVNTTKAWIKRQLETSGNDQPKFHGAHIGLTAVMESLLMSVLNLINSQLPKDKSSLYKITLPVLSYSLQTDDDYSRIFKPYLSSYDSDMNYSDQFWMSRSDVNSFIESHFGDNIQLEPRAYNMLAYCMLKYAGLLIRTSYYLMTYAGKKTLEPKAIRASVLIHTPDTIANSIVMKLDDSVKNTSEDDEDESEEVKESSSKKQAAKEVSDSEDESDSDAEQSESESESEQEVKPAKGKKTVEKVVEKTVEKEDKKVKVKKSKD